MRWAAYDNRGLGLKLSIALRYALPPSMSQYYCPEIPAWVEGGLYVGLVIGPYSSASVTGEGIERFVVLFKDDSWATIYLSTGSDFIVLDILVDWPCM